MSVGQHKIHLKPSQAFGACLAPATYSLGVEYDLDFIGLPIVPMLCKNEARAFDPTV